MKRKASGKNGGYKGLGGSGRQKPPRERKPSAPAPDGEFPLSRLMKTYGGSFEDWNRRIRAGDLKARKDPATGEYFVTRQSFRRTVAEALGLGRSTLRRPKMK